MPKSLVIVESPAKAKTLEKFLGRDFKVLASYGHVRDLPRKGLGVDREHHYKPSYELLAGKEKTINELKKAAKAADNVYLAADPDREGEAISWHLQEALKPGAGKTIFRRVRFNEITKKAVLAAMEAGRRDRRTPRRRPAGPPHHRPARRLRGLGPPLEKDLAGPLRRPRPDGRPADHLRARERDRGVRPGRVLDGRRDAGGKDDPPPSRRDCPRSTARSSSSTGRTRACRTKRGRARARRGRRRDVDGDLRRDDRAAQEPGAALHHVAAPAGRGAPPRLRGAPHDADRPAALRRPEIPGRGTVGLITYMRTDSTRVSQDALTAVRELIGKQYGAESLPESARYFKSRRDTQDAHEAIRPTYLDLPPEEVEKHVAPEEAKLYRLIWQRFVASQMSPAVYDTTAAEIAAGKAALPGLGLDAEVPRLPRGLRHLRRGRGGSRQGHAEAAAALGRRDARSSSRSGPRRRRRSRRPASTRPRSSSSSRRTASAGRRRTPRSCARSRSGATSTAGTAASSRPPSAAP